MDIYVPGRAPHLVISEQMVADLMTEPVMAAKLIMGVELDIFQAVALKFYWWVPKVINSTGFSAGKTYVDWVWSNLRRILIPDTVGLVYYQTFQSMKDNFWPYYDRCRHPLYRAQLGQVVVDDEDDEGGRKKLKGPSCWKVFFRNESELQHPAPGFFQSASGQASRRANDLLVDEWTKAEAMSSKGSGIDEQLLGRVTRESSNKNHPIWCNHMKFSATAESQLHPGWKRVRSFLRQVEGGSAQHATFSFCYKDYSGKKTSNGKSFRERFRVDDTIRDMKDSFSTAKVLEEILGIWSKTGKGWYTAELIQYAQQLAERLGIVIETHRGEREEERETGEGGMERKRILNRE